MKKTLVILIIISVLLCGCSQKNEEIKQIELNTEIATEAIMTSTISPEEVAKQEKEKVLEIEREYYPEIREAISKLKSELRNPEAIMTSTISPEEVAKQEKEKVLEIEREYYPEIREAISKLKSELRNPASLKIEECIVYNHILELEQINFSDIYFTYSAQNGFGNNLTSYYKYNTSSKVGISDVSTYDIAKNNAKGKDKNQKLYIPSKQCTFSGNSEHLNPINTSSKMGISDVSTYDIAKNNAKGEDKNQKFNF